jgi:hypothetical protein
LPGGANSVLDPELNELVAVRYPFYRGQIGAFSETGGESPGQNEARPNENEENDDENIVIPDKPIVAIHVLSGRTIPRQS